MNKSRPGFGIEATAPVTPSRAAFFFLALAKLVRLTYNTITDYVNLT